MQRTPYPRDPTDAQQQLLASRLPAAQMEGRRGEEYLLRMEPLSALESRAFGTYPLEYKTGPATPFAQPNGIGVKT